MLLSSATPAALGSGSLDKLDGNLAGVYREYQLQVESGALRSPIAFVPRNVVANVQDGRVLVEAFADDGDGAALANQLQALGGTGVASYGREADAAVPITALPQLAGLASLRFARASDSMTMAGAVNDQGDTSQRSTNERANLGYDGTGVKVGVLSDSFNNLGGASNDVASGDLPAVGVQVLQDFASGGTDEGRAMLQIVHDVAPGASLAFATAENGQANFANNITALKNAGAKVIVDDVQYFAEPMFQDGVVAQAVDGFVAAGASYFSSAGNQANNGYASAWRTANTYAPGQIALDPTAFSNAVPFAGGTSFDFDPGPGVDDMLSVSLPAGRSFTMALGWDSPSFSVSGGTGSPNDLDIYWMNPATGKVIFDITSNNTGGDAIETMRITAGSQPLNAALMFVSKSGGPLPSQIKFVTFSRTLAVNEYGGYNAGSTYGHANAAGAQSVGAVSWLTTPAYSGIGLATLESFSSLGGTPILFDTAGNRLATPQNRSHTDITAPDGGNTSGFTGGLNPFFGTSAAAPHAGAVAALMLQANPALTTSQIYSDLHATALDMDNPYTPGFDVGYDPASGYGLMQADAAVLAALPSGTAVPVAGYWTGQGDGSSWNDALNWSANTIPTSSTDVFIDVANNPTINIAGAASVRSIQSTEALNIASGGSLSYTANSLVGNVTLNNGGAVNSPGSGSIITLTALGNFNWVTGGQLNGAGRLTIASSGVLNITGGGAHFSAQQLTLNGGTAQTAVGGNAVIVLPVLNIGTSGFFNLADGTLIIDHSGADQSSVIAGFITNGRHGGAWDGVNGINSSTAAASGPTRTLGFGPASTVFGSFPATFAGQSIDTLATLVRFTIAGDANLDRHVDVSDLGVLATYWQTSAKPFTQGDFNYDSLVDVSDLGILATNWQNSLPAPAPAAPTSLVPAAPGDAVSSGHRKSDQHALIGDVLG